MTTLQPADLVGAWRLRRWETVYEDGRRTEPFGPGVQGLIQYTADGWMSATIMAPGRAKLSRANPRNAPARERAAAFDSYFSYAGRWRVNRGVVRHDVTIALNPALVGTPQLRDAVLSGRTLTLSAAEDVPGGRRVHRLVWRRAPKR
ncbi:MAG: lipocalin-like domain-containing protein [Steroidobacteraceae bacterium]|jgi:hypothetical protein|nr:lipocalin-like domain-containing protein [Steroidobacteraceae bacterium]